jgi:Mg2+ and Co2+ transporter CorA
MSLKIVHILFVSLATLVTIGFGVWGVNFTNENGTHPFKALGICAFVFAAGLIVYGIKFLKKFQNLR